MRMRQYTLDIFVEGKIIVIHMVLLLESSHEALSLSLASSSSGVGFGSSRETHPLDVGSCNPAAANHGSPSANMR